MGVIYVKEKEQDVQQRTEAYSSASIPEWRGGVMKLYEKNTE